MELRGRRRRGRPERRYMDAVWEDMRVVGVRVEDAEMENIDLLWQPLPPLDFLLCLHASPFSHLHHYFP